jgi:site-specific DNA recombinase
METNWDNKDKETACPGRVHGYVRVSTREQAVDGLSLSIQEQNIRQLASSQYPDREFILWSDPAQSARSIPLGQRKAGKAMLGDARRGDIIVGAKFDRLFRSMQDTHNQLAELEANGIELIILQIAREPLGQSVTGKALVSILALVAELESDFIRQRITDGKAAKAALGGFAGGQVPIGFRKVGTGREARLVEDEREQEMLKVARELRAKGETFSEITEKLDRFGFRSRKGTPVLRSQVYEYIQRPRGNRQQETKSQRIRQGIAKRKAKGLPIGNPRVHEITRLGLARIKERAAAFRQEVMPIIEEIIAANPLKVTLQSIADELNDRRVATARGKIWYACTVRELLKHEKKSLLHPRYRLDGNGPLQDRVLTSDNDTTGLSQRGVVNDEHLHEMIAMLPKLMLFKKRGWSYRKLEREFGFARRTMERQFAKQREKWRQMGSEGKKEVIVQLAAIGWSRQDIIEDVRVSNRTVYRHFPPGANAAAPGGETKSGVPTPVAADPLSMAHSPSKTQKGVSSAINETIADRRSKKRSNVSADASKTNMNRAQLRLFGLE